MMQLNTLITQHTWSSDYSLETWLMIQQWTARSRANTFSQSNLWLIGPSSAQDDYLTSPCYKNSSLWESDGYEVKGAGWSHDDVSQSQQTREETSYSQPMHIEETSTEAKLGETKLKRVEKEAESKAPSGSTGESSRFYATKWCQSEDSNRS